MRICRLKWVCLLVESKKVGLKKKSGGNIFLIEFFSLFLYLVTCRVK